MRTLPLIQHSGCGTYRHLCLQSVGPLSNTVMSRQQQAWSSPASYNGSEAILQPGSSELGRAEDHIYLTDLEKLRSKFEAADRDGNGTLDFEEFAACFDQLFQLKGKNEKEVVRFFYKIDYNSDGYIDWDEFCSYMYLELHERDNALMRSRKVDFQLPAVVATSNPHKDGLCRISHLSDGSLLTCSSEGTLCFWDENLKPKKSKLTKACQPGRRKWVTDMSVCPPQGKIVLITGDHELQCYEMANFAPHCQLKKLESVPLRLHFWYNPGRVSDSIILIGDKDGALTVITTTSIQEAFKHWKRGPKGEDGLPTFSIDRLSMEAVPGVKIYRWKLHSDWTSEISYFPTLRCFASCSCDPNASLVLGSPSGSTEAEGDVQPMRKASVVARARTNRGSLPARQRVCGDHRVFKSAKGFSSVDFCSRNNIIVTGSLDQIVRTWNPFITHKPMGKLFGHDAPVFSVRVEPHTNRIYSVGSDNTVKVWHILDLICLQTVAPCAHKVGTPVEAFHVNPVSHCVLLGSDHLAVLKLAMAAGLRNDIVQTHTQPVAAVCHSKCFDQAVTACERGVVKVWDIESGQFVFEFSVQSGISAMDIDSCGRRLVTGTQGGEIKLWNYNNGYCIRQLDKGNSDEITDVKFMSLNTNQYITTVGWDRKISYFADVQVGKLPHIDTPLQAWSSSTVRELESVHTEDILSVAYHPHFQVMASSSYDGEVIAWSLVSSRIVARLKSHLSVRDPMSSLQGNNVVHKVLFLLKRSKCRESATLVSSGPSGCIHFWNYHRPSVPMGHFSVDSTVTSMAVNESESYLFSADSEGYVKRWEVGGYCISSKAVQPPDCSVSWQAHTQRISKLELVEAHTLVLTASVDSSVRVWTFEGDYIGTFGQEAEWKLGDPRTYQPCPSDVVGGEGGEAQNGGVVVAAENPVNDEVGASAQTSEEHFETKSDGPHLLEHVPFDIPSSDSRSPGKRLRHVRAKSARQGVSPGVYGALPCEPLLDLPPITPPSSHQ